MRTWIAPLALFTLALGVLSIATWAVTGNPPVVDVNSTGSSLQIGAEMESLPTARNFLDTLAIVPGVKVSTAEVDFSSSTELADGVSGEWGCEPRGKELVCSGPPARAVYFTLRGPWGSGQYNKWSRNGLDLSVNYGTLPEGGTSLIDTRVAEYDNVIPQDVSQDVGDSLDNIALQPGTLHPGEPFMLGAIDPAYSRGDWEIKWGENAQWQQSFDYRDAWGRLTDTLDPAIESDLRTRYFFNVPGNLADGSRVGIRYRNPWDDIRVEHWFDYVASEMPLGPCDPKMVVCKPRAAIGGAFCICGCFPEGAGAAFLIDGRPLFPITGSRSSAWFILPDWVTEGPHTVTFNNSVLAGLDLAPSNDAVQFEAVRVAGKVDPDLLHLKKRRNALMTFWLRGSQERSWFRIEKTQGQVRIHGGDKQRVLSSGGANNRIERILEAHGVGKFNVAYRVLLPPCPCDEYADEEEVELYHSPDNFVVHKAFQGGSREPLFVLPSNASWGFPGAGLAANLRIDDAVIRSPTPPLMPGNSYRMEVEQFQGKLGFEGLDDWNLQLSANYDSTVTLEDVETDTEGRLTGGYGRVDLHLDALFTNPAQLPKNQLEGSPIQHVPSSLWTAGVAQQFTGDFTALDLQWDQGTFEFLSTGDPLSITAGPFAPNASGETLRGDVHIQMQTQIRLRYEF